MGNLKLVLILKLQDYDTLTVKKCFQRLFQFQSLELLGVHDILLIFF